MDDVTEELRPAELPAAATCAGTQREQALAGADPDCICHASKHPCGLAPLSTARLGRGCALPRPQWSGRHGLADEQKRRQDVQWLEAASDVAKDALQVAQDARGELVHEKRAAGLEHVVGLLQDALAQRRRDGTEGNARDDVIGAQVPVTAQDLIDRLRRALDDLQTLVAEGTVQIADKVGIHLDGDEYRVRTHAPQNLLRDDSDTGPVLDDHAGAAEVDRLQQLLEEET